MKKKYIFLRLETRDGEREYEHESVHQIRTKKTIEQWAEDYLSDFWMGGSEKTDDNTPSYEFFGGEIITSIHSVREIPKEHYDILKQYL